MAPAIRRARAVPRNARLRKPVHSRRSAEPHRLGFQFYRRAAPALSPPIFESLHRIFAPRPPAREPPPVDRRCTPSPQTRDLRPSRHWRRAAVAGGARQGGGGGSTRPESFLARKNAYRSDSSVPTRFHSARDA